MKRYFLLIILLIPFVHATSIQEWDSWGDDDCLADSCGTTFDDKIFISGRASYEITSPGTHVDVICADIYGDATYDSCVYKNSTVLAQCQSFYSGSVGSVPSDSLFDCGGSFTLCGWGYYDDDPGISLNGDFLACSGGEGVCSDVQNTLDTDVVFDSETILFREYRDCDNSAGQRGTTQFSNNELSVADKKGLVCDGLFVDSKAYYGSVGDGIIQNNYISCSYIDPTFGVEIGYCDVNNEYNTTVFDENFDYPSLCEINTSILDYYYDINYRPCEDNRLTSGTNETLIDYGGICGNCTFNTTNSEDDLTYALAKVLFVEENGRINYDNAFNSSYCEVAEPTITTPLFFLMFIMILALLIAGFIIIIVVIFISLFISLTVREITRVSVNQAKKFINNRKK